MPHVTELFSQIRKANNTLLICHRRPDGDTAGSAGALAFYISEELNKPVSLFCVDELPESLDFLQIEAFVLDESQKLKVKSQKSWNNFDLIIALDCADMPQTGIPDELSELKGSIPIINIDHHRTNTFFGAMNLVNAEASATAEIVFELFKKNGVNMTKEITTCLMTGILTDTTYFSNAATTEKAVQAASDLLSNGAKMKQVIQNTWARHSPESLKMWGRVLADLQFNVEYKIVTAIVADEAAIDKSEIFEGLANFLTSIYEADIVLVIKQDKNDQIKCSLRTTKDGINVAALAKELGGGGHVKAAGFSCGGRIVRDQEGWSIV